MVKRNSICIILGLLLVVALVAGCKACLPDKDKLVKPLKSATSSDNLTYAHELLVKYREDGTLLLVDLKKSSIKSEKLVLGGNYVAKRFFEGSISPSSSNITVPLQDVVGGKSFPVYLPYADDTNKIEIIDPAGKLLLQTDVKPPVEPPPQPPFYKKPLFLVLAALFIIVVAVIISLALRGRAPKAVSERPREEPPTPPVLSAKLLLPGNLELALAGNQVVIGRSEMARAVEINDLQLISRRHFMVGFGNGQYYVEDLGSLNGTRLNGAEIKGRGKLVLNDGDRIGIADAVAVSFAMQRKAQ